MSRWDVTVTWMDGQKETYRAGRAVVDAGVLKIEAEGTNYPTVTRYVPLDSVRIFVVEER